MQATVPAVLLLLGLHLLIGCNDKSRDRINRDNIAKEQRGRLALLKASHANASEAVNANNKTAVTAFRSIDQGKATEYAENTESHEWIPTFYRINSRVTIISESAVITKSRLTEKQVFKIIGVNLVDIRHCYEEFLRVKRLTGVMNLNFVIDNDGNVNSVTFANDSMTDPMMRECVTGQIKRWTFPRQMPNGKSSILANVKFGFEFNNSEQDSISNPIQIVVGGKELTQYFSIGPHPKLLIEMQEGKEFSVRVINRFHCKTTVAVAVDGLNSIDATRTSPDKAKKWIIEPMQTITIKGWQEASNRLRKFVFTSGKDSYGAMHGNIADLGTISVTQYLERNRGLDCYVDPTIKFWKSKSGWSNGSVKTLGAVGMEKMTASQPAANAMSHSQKKGIKFVNNDFEPSPIKHQSIHYERREVLEKLVIFPTKRSTEDAVRRKESGQDIQKVSVSPEQI